MMNRIVPLFVAAVMVASPAFATTSGSTGSSAGAHGGSASSGGAHSGGHGGSSGLHARSAVHAVSARSTTHGYNHGHHHHYRWTNIASGAHRIPQRCSPIADYYGPQNLVCGVPTKVSMDEVSGAAVQ